MWPEVENEGNLLLRPPCGPKVRMRGEGISVPGQVRAGVRGGRPTAGKAAAVRTEERLGCWDQREQDRPARGGRQGCIVQGLEIRSVL